MTKNQVIFIEHILESIIHIETYMRDKTQKDFLKNQQLQDAVIRRLEIIGEAVKNLNIGFTNKYPEIPWRDIAGTRDKLIHHYFGVEVKITYDIIKKRIPILKKQIQEILKEESKNNNQIK